MPDPSYSSPCPVGAPDFPCNIYTSFLARVNLAKSFAAAASWSAQWERKEGRGLVGGDGQQVGSWHIAGHRVMDGTGIASRRVAWNFAEHKYFYHFSLACLFVSVVSVLSRSDATDVDTLGRLEWLPTSPLRPQSPHSAWIAHSAWELIQIKALKPSSKATARFVRLIQFVTR